MAQAITDQETEKLYKVTVQANDTLFSIDSIFPFTLIPDTVTLDREKVTFIHRLFFQTAQIISVRISEILSIEADVGPLFGSLKMTSRFFVKNPTRINWLWREDAIKMRDLIQGYIITAQKEIDCSNTPTEELKLLLQNLGHSSTEK